MALTDELKILDDKSKANQAQYDLGRQAAKISALFLSSKDLLEKYEYLTGEDLEHRPSVLEKTKFDYSPLGMLLSKSFTNITKSEDESDFNYDGYHKFYEFYKGYDEFEEMLLDSKYSKMSNVTNLLTKFKNLKPKTPETQLEKAAAQVDNPARKRIDAPTNAIFKITDTKLNIPVVTLSTKGDNNFLEQLKSGFKRTIKRNKYRSEMTSQTKTNDLNHLIDPTFTKVNKLFVLSFENEEDRTSFSKYYVPIVERKDFNVIIDGKLFVDVPVKKHTKKL